MTDQDRIAKARAIVEQTLGATDQVVIPEYVGRWRSVSEELIQRIAAALTEAAEVERKDDAFVCQHHGCMWEAHEAERAERDALQKRVDQFERALKGREISSTYEPKECCGE